MLFSGRIVLFGFGSIGSGLLPLIKKKFQNPNVTIITSDDRNIHIAQIFDAKHIIKRITKQNLISIMEEYLHSGDFAVNVTVDVRCLDMIQWCQNHDVLYIDTVIEPWGGFYTDPTRTMQERTNYFLRQELIQYRDKFHQPTTSVIAHGANPGLVSHFVKAALLHMMEKAKLPIEPPSTRAGWVCLAHELGVKIIQIAERDSQRSLSPRRPGEFVNTWSVDGFIAESCQPAELGWGTHEKNLPPDVGLHPPDAVADSGARPGHIYLCSAGIAMRVRSWTPGGEAAHAWLITHNESLSIADYFSGDVGGRPYRPTVYYAYRPCDAAALSLDEMLARDLDAPSVRKVLTADDVVDGADELGVLLLGSPLGALWYGSRLTIEQARAAAPFNTATSLQALAAPHCLPDA